MINHSRFPQTATIVIKHLSSTHNEDIFAIFAERSPKTTS